MATVPPALVIPAGQTGQVLQFFRAITDRLETLQGGRTINDRAVTVSDLTDLGLLKTVDKSLALGPAAQPESLVDLMNPAGMEEYYKVDQVAGDHELLLYDWREKKFRRLDWALMGAVVWATCAEADAGVIENKAINPKVGACSYDRKRRWGQHEAGKGTETVVLTPNSGVVTIDQHASNVFHLTLTQNVSIANPVNPINGQTVNVHLKQDAVGGRTVSSWGSKWKFVNKINPVLSTDPNAIDLLSCQWNEVDGIMECSFLPNYGAGSVATPPASSDLTFANVGGGNQVYRNTVGTTVNFRTLVGQGDISVSTVGDTIVFDFTAPAGSSIGSVDDIPGVDAPSPVAGDTLMFDGTNWVNVAGRKWSLGATWTNGTSEISGAVNEVNVVVAEKCRILSWYLLTEGSSGSCVVDVRRVAFTSYPPGAGNSICGGSKPTITAAVSAADTDLGGWSVDCNESDVLTFVLESTSGFSVVQIVLIVQRIP